MAKSLLMFFLSVGMGVSVHAQQIEYIPEGFCPEVVDYTYYSLCYDSNHRQARWVKYKLTRDFVNGKQKRTNNYRMDPNIEDPVFSSDYRGSGYDRGHLLPAADMKLNYKAMSETFFMTNMSPQKPGFNRYIWASIEKQVRELVKKHGDAHVVTAGILESGLATIFSGVSIPQMYFKVLYFPEVEIMKAFLIENRTYEKGVSSSDFLVSVDEIEVLTGYDFFEELPDPVENHLEATLFRE